MTDLYNTAMEETINGNPLSYFGATLLHGSYAELMTPADLKEWVSNEDVTKDGTDYLVPSTPLLAERNVSLHFGIKRDSESEFLTSYNIFVDMLQSGIIDLFVPRLGRHYFLKFETCTSYDNFSLKACKIAVKFTEPNPRKKF